MYKILVMTAIAALLAGCADEVAEVIVPTDEVITVCDPEDPETCTSEVDINNGVVSIGDLQAVSYNGTTLRVQIALDGPDALQAYDPDGALAGYNKFTYAISDENRAFTAFAGRSSGGEVTAVVAMDSGQFNRFFAGATVIQDQEAFSPAAGTASYSGDYVGLIYRDTGLDEVTGVVFLNANFTDNKVEGVVTDREIFEVAALDDLIFVNTVIQPDGVFGGGIENEDKGPIGAYGGAFGGSQAQYVGGALTASGDLGGDVTGDEFGIFVIETCGPIGTDCLP
jgi:hypothetical protein